MRWVYWCGPRSLPWRTFYLRGSIHKNQLDLGSAIQHRAEQTLREMIRRDYNHPSIIIWTIVNEDWGTSLPLSASDRRVGVGHVRPVQAAGSHASRGRQFALPA